MRSLPLVSADHQAHVPFKHIAPYLRSSLLLGCGGGFALATVLTLSPLFGVPLGSWWLAIVQTHGQIQLYGWAGLFVAGVALYFLPRLRGKPLTQPSLLPWILGIWVSSLILRFLSQPLLAVTGSLIWKIMLVLSGVLEALVFPTVLFLLVRTSLNASETKKKVDGENGIASFILGAFLSLSLVGILNLFNCVAALLNNGLVPVVGDQASITLGLFGFLVPIALAMSTRMLPLYTRIQPFPVFLLRILALAYFGGVFFWLLGFIFPGLSFALLDSLGLFLIGMVILIFTGYFLYLIRNRARAPLNAVVSTSYSKVLEERARQGRYEERRKYGPYVALIGSAYIWGSLGALFLVIDGLAALLFQTLPVSIDAIRHSFAIGFISLLLCGIAVRMVPGFSSRTIRSPKLVTATLILGNLAVAMRVGSLLLMPVLPGATLFFTISGPTGLALVLCFTVNLWSAL